MVANVVGRAIEKPHPEFATLFVANAEFAFGTYRWCIIPPVILASPSGALWLFIMKNGISYQMATTTKNICTVIIIFASVTGIPSLITISVKPVTPINIAGHIIRLVSITTFT